MMQKLVKNVCYPLWDWKDRSTRLQRLADLEQTQWWSAEEKEAHQWISLRNAVEYARTYSPYYRRVLSEHDVGEMKSMRDFRRIPITTKSDIRQYGQQFLSDEYSRERLVNAKTGGSTGVALNLYFDVRCEERRNAAEMRGDRWAGWDLGVTRGALWGNPPKGFSFKRWLRNTLLLRTFVLDTMEMTPESMGAFIDKANAKSPVVLFGHAHSLYILARYIERSGRRVHKPLGIISTSMMLLENERSVIERVFGCGVTNRYGCEEVGLIASQCERHGGLHINTDDLVVEVVSEDGSRVASGTPGRIVVTDLSNRGMPLLRYRVEDVGTISNTQCDCGRAGPLLHSIGGRVAEYLRKPDGTMVAGVSLVERTLTAVPGIEQMQFVQKAVDTLQVNLVPDSQYSRRTEELLVAELRSVFGRDVSIHLNVVEGIQQEKNGKFRFAICQI